MASALEYPGPLIESLTTELNTILVDGLIPHRAGVVGRSGNRLVEYVRGGALSRRHVSICTRLTLRLLRPRLGLGLLRRLAHLHLLKIHVLWRPLLLQPGHICSRNLQGLILMQVSGIGLELGPFMLTQNLHRIRGP